MLGDSAPVHALCLHMAAGGYLYYSAFSQWASNEGRFEWRRVSVIPFGNIARSLRALGHEPLELLVPSDFSRWRWRQGWALVPEFIAQKLLPEMLEPRKCLKSAMGSFTDQEIAAPSASTRRGSAILRRRVLRRAVGGRCMLCDAPDAVENPITLHHVMPYSDSGETTAENLLPLCRSCNARIGPRHIPSLNRLLHVPHLIDPAVVKVVDRRFLEVAIQFTSNLLHSRAELHLVGLALR